MDQTPKSNHLYLSCILRTETSEKILKNDIDHIIDDTKNTIIDVEKLEDDFKHCYKNVVKNVS